MTIKDYIYGSLIVVLLGLFGWTYHRGAQACVSSDEKAASAEGAIIAHAEGVSSEKVKEEAKSYEEAVTAPVTAPVVQLCAPAVAPGRHQVLPATAPTARAGEAASVPEEHPVVPAVFQWDSKPVVSQGRDADAQVNGLLAYIKDNCHS